MTSQARLPPSFAPVSQARTVVALVAATVSLLLASPAHAAGDAEEGAKVFRRCAVCHTAEQGGPNKIGPNLWAVIGSTSGTRKTRFRYSRALRNAAITWNDETLLRWVENPQAFVPGTRMTFPGLPDAQEREDVIAYLRQVAQ